MDAVQTMAAKSVEARLQRLAKLKTQAEEIRARFLEAGNALSLEMDARLDAITAAVQPQIDALLASVQPALDAVRAEYAPRMAEFETQQEAEITPVEVEFFAAKAVAECQVKALGKSVKAAGVQCVFYKGKVSMNNDRVMGFLQAQAAIVPDFKLGDYYSVGEPYVQWRGL